MEKIASFTIDHIKLKPGIYVSRKDHVGDSIITTFDLRMTSPNDEPVMNTAEVHTIEHLGATFLRNHEQWKDKTVYFGPMGCRTGFYLLLAGDYTSRDIVPLVTEMYEFIRDFKGEVPGASPKDCGNYLDMNLPMAIEYPKICPAVITAVRNGNKLLLSKYAGREYVHYALIAGFTEIGETIEETVKREVMEEVGLKVKNLHFYKSQPWSFSGTLLFGFFCDLDGEDTISLDEEELSMAVWMERENIPDDPEQISLTREMMTVFKNGEDKKYC